MPPIDAPRSVTDFYSSKLPWRFSTPLNKDQGARSVRIPPQVFPAGVTVPLVQCLYDNYTIDRIIGLMFNVIAPIPTGPMVLTLMDRNSKWRQDVAVAQHFGCLYTNVETNTDQCDIIAISSVALQSAQVTLYNFEISNSHPGHY